MSAYYIIYDLSDNIIAYLDNEAEVISFTGIRKDHLRDRIKKGFCLYSYQNTYRKIYKFG